MIGLRYAGGPETLKNNLRCRPRPLRQFTEPQAFSAVDQRKRFIQAFPDDDTTSSNLKHLVLALDLEVPIPPSDRPIVLNPAWFCKAEDVLEVEPASPAMDQSRIALLPFRFQTRFI